MSASAKGCAKRKPSTSRSVQKYAAQSGAKTIAMSAKGIGAWGCRFGSGTGGLRGAGARRHHRLDHRARGGDDPDGALERAARFARAGRNLGELHQVAGREPALDLADHDLAARVPPQLRDQLVGGQLQRIEAEPRAEILADHLRDREIERAVVGVLQKTVGPQ